MKDDFAKGVLRDARTTGPGPSVISLPSGLNGETTTPGLTIGWDHSDNHTEPRDLEECDMLTEKIFAVAQNGAEVVLWFLLALSILSIGIILERFFALRTVKRQSESMRVRLQSLIRSNSLKEIEDLSRDRDSLEGQALAYGLRHIEENGSEGLSEFLTSFALTEKPPLERYLNFLATVGSNAPFIGLLGTVLGIMKAFNDLSVSQAADNRVVMAGIAEALVATAVGLLVAIPAVIAYNYFQRQVKSSLTSLESVRELCLAYSKKKGK